MGTIQPQSLVIPFTFFTVRDSPHVILASEHSLENSIWVYYCEKSLVMAPKSKFVTNSAREVRCTKVQMNPGLRVLGILTLSLKFWSEKSIRANSLKIEISGENIFHFRSSAMVKWTTEHSIWSILILLNKSMMFSNILTVMIRSITGLDIGLGTYPRFFTVIDPYQMRGSVDCHVQWKVLSLMMEMELWPCGQDYAKIWSQIFGNRIFSISALSQGEWDKFLDLRNN